MVQCPLDSIILWLVNGWFGGYGDGTIVYMYMCMLVYTVLIAYRAADLSKIHVLFGSRSSLCVEYLSNFSESIIFHDHVT